MVEAYFRNARKINQEWEYSVPHCMAEFQEKFQNFILDYKDFVNHLKYSVGLFHETGSVGRK